MTDQLEITDPRDGSQQSVAVPSGLVHLRADGGTIVLSPDASGASLRIVPTQRGRRLEPLLPGSMIEVSGQQLFCKDLAPGDRFEFAGRRIVWRSDVELPLAGAASRSTQRPRRHDGAAAAKQTVVEDASASSRRRPQPRSSRALVLVLMSLSIGVGWVVLRFFDMRKSVPDPSDRVDLARTQFESGQYDRALSTIRQAMEHEVPQDVRRAAEELTAQIATTQKAVVDSVAVQQGREAADLLQTFVERYAQGRLQRPAARELLRLCDAWQNTHGAVASLSTDGARTAAAVVALRDRAAAVAEASTPDTAADAMFAARTHLRFVIREYRAAVVRLDAFLAAHPGDQSVVGERTALVAEARAWLASQLPKIEQKLTRGDVDAARAEFAQFEKYALLPENEAVVAELRQRLRAATAQSGDSPMVDAPAAGR